jgi:UDP-glucose 4-epimerase
MSTRPRILLTGATGFIGRHVLAHLLGNDLEVVPVGRRIPPSPAPAGFLRCDLSSPEGVDVLRGVEPDVVVHLAAHMPGPTSTEDPVQANLTANVLATANLVRACPGTRYLIYISTVDVYGTPESLPIDERHPTNPTTYYGATKLAAEKLLAVHCGQTGADLLILRLTQTYGPGESPIKILPQTIARVAAGQPPILFGDGSDRRDYMHVSDVAEAIARSLQVKPVGVLNLASGESRPVADVVEAVLRVAALDTRPTVLPRAKPCVHFAFDVSRLRQALGTWPLKDFETGVREQFECWTRTNSPSST